MDTINKLLDDLALIETTPEIESILTEEQVSEGYSVDELHPLVQQVIGLADGLLITNTGQCNWSNIEVLKRSGFNVTAGEQDSFGWLTGVIHTKKGTIQYG